MVFPKLIKSDAIKEKKINREEPRSITKQILIESEHFDFFLNNCNS